MLSILQSQTLKTQNVVGNKFSDKGRKGHLNQDIKHYLQSLHPLPPTPPKKNK